MSDITKSDIENAWIKLRKEWDKSGDCASCGWHASLAEHNVDDFDIGDALATGGILHMACDNEDAAQDRFDHRGVSVYIGPEE